MIREIVDIALYLHRFVLKSHSYTERKMLYSKVIKKSAFFAYSTGTEEQTILKLRTFNSIC